MNVKLGFKSILLAAALAAMLLAPAETWAQKGNKPGGGGTTPTYMLVDLLGFPDHGYQSQGEFITNRDANGNVLVYGNSRLYPDPSGPAVFHPALWTVRLDGTFPSSNPLDMGLPSWARELQTAGINSFGFAVGDTSWAKEQDANGNWIFPGYVDVPGLGYQELPAPNNRNASVAGINDAGIIVGQFMVVTDDPLDLDGLDYVAGIWQVNEHGSVTGPTSLGTSPREFLPTDINNYGVISANYYGFPTVAWFDGNGELQIKLLDGAPQFFGADVTALNDYPPGDPRLTVVGHSWRDADGNYTPGDRRGYAWQPWSTANPTTVLGTLGGRQSIVHDVNSNGDIVGWSHTKRSDQHAFIYKNGKMLDLNSQVDVGHKTLTRALAINDEGDIVGFMDIPRPVSEQRGFLMRPIE